MHGRVKVRTTAEQEEIKKKERAKKLVHYRTAMTEIFRKRENKIWDDELLLLTEKILLQNPDVYTLWNIRREVFQNNKNNIWNEEEYTSMLEKELTLSENCLKNNPKSYSVWHQRWWVMEHIQKPDWEKELTLCTKCLNLDERNFHCWDYRQYVVEKAGISDHAEYEFSTTKILNNFSNYSSWHYRSKILTKLFYNDSEETPVMQQKREEELELVMNATFTDPNDSSAWFYQRWLLDNYKPKSHSILWRSRVTKDMVIAVFNNDISGESENISLFVDNNKIDIQWKSYKEKIFSKVWSGMLSTSLENLSELQNVYININDKNYQLYYSQKEFAWIYKSDSLIINENHNKEQLNEQLESYKQLAKMEPNNKWAILIGIFLMKKIDFINFNNIILEDLNTLSRIDFLRSNYYKDLRSKYLLEYTFKKIWEEENDSEIQKKIDLSGLNLTMLHNSHYFTFFEEINLSANNLEISLNQLSSFQYCKKLSLSSNQIKSLKHFPTLKNLEFLSLRNNEISDINEILDLIKRHNLMKLDLRDNPIYDLYKNDLGIAKVIQTNVILI
ncbi:geranylgeranyl transferase type-2 subunit alpha-like isoform X1 [Vespa mandarinia]|uniref:geranylgeranyl transferase type-2 subunit alpha-like isoform X1 n=2 Tax=Vespa mandarinia TaxID=7446 RepID=UPI00161476E8|nr:geranylgeranyl transferase type-2 subunit alpha-like isoform X1 [Vespa mandarinia]